MQSTCARAWSSRRRSRSSRTARRIPSSASSSRTSRDAATAASPGSSATTASCTALCHLGTNVVPSGSGSGAFADLAARLSPRMLIGEEAAVTELWEAGRKRFGRPREDRPAQPVYVSDDAARAGRHGAPARDPRRPRHARARVRAGAPRGGRRRPDAARPERLSLADAHADRRGPLVGLARGRRDPVQGRGVGVDAGRRAAPAGVGRSARTPERQRVTRAPRPDPACCSRASRRSASSSARRTRPRSGSTRRSACGTRSRTGACCSETPAPGAPCARPLECGRPDQLAAARRGPLRPRRRGGARASRGVGARADRARGRDEAPPHAGDARARARRS